MKKLLLVVFIIILSISGFAQQKGFGLGVIAGEPTGISAKYWTSEINAFDFGLGYSFTSKESLFHFYIDYASHNTDIIKTDKDFIVYYGPGARLKIYKNKTRLGVRGVAGILWLPDDTPLDIFFELAPVFDIIPETRFDFAGGVGIRYFFN